MLLFVLMRDQILWQICNAHLMAHPPPLCEFFLRQDHQYSPPKYCLPYTSQLQLVTNAVSAVRRRWRKGRPRGATATAPAKKVGPRRRSGGPSPTPSTSPPLPLSSPINSVSLRLPPGRHGATRRGFLGGTAKRYSAWSKWLASNLGRRLDVEAGNDRKLHFRFDFLSQI